MTDGASSQPTSLIRRIFGAVAVIGFFACIVLVPFQIWTWSVRAREADIEYLEANGFYLGTHDEPDPTLFAGLKRLALGCDPRKPIESVASSSSAPPPLNSQLHTTLLRVIFQERQLETIAVPLHIDDPTMAALVRLRSLERLDIPNEVEFSSAWIKSIPDRSNLNCVFVLTKSFSTEAIQELLYSTSITEVAVPAHAINEGLVRQIAAIKKFKNLFIHVFADEPVPPNLSDLLSGLPKEVGLYFCGPEETTTPRPSLYLRDLVAERVWFLWLDEVEVEGADNAKYFHIQTSNRIRCQNISGTALLGAAKSIEIEDCPNLTDVSISAIERGLISIRECEQLKFVRFQSINVDDTQLTDLPQLESVRVSALTTKFAKQLTLFPTICKVFVDIGKTEEGALAELRILPHLKELDITIYNQTTLSFLKDELGQLKHVNKVIIWTNQMIPINVEVDILRERYPAINFEVK